MHDWDFVGRKIVEPAVVASAKAVRWTRAPLFVAQTERASSVDRLSTGGVPAAAFARDMTAITPQSGNLFVVRTTARVSR